MYHIVMDIETTGLDKLKDTPIQIAWNVLKEKKLIEEGAFYIKPDIALPEIITRITGMKEEILTTQGYANSVGTKKYMDLIWQYQPATLIGHNLISFDYPILHNWMESFYPGRFKQPPIVQLIDTMHLASVKFKTKKWTKLEDCGKRLDILFNKEQLHNAIADVRLTKEVYLALLD